MVRLRADTGLASSATLEALAPALTKGLVALCEERPAEPVSWLATWLLANKPTPPARPAPVSGRLLSSSVSNVPEKVHALFAKLDTNHDGLLSREELISGLSSEFPDLPAHCLEAIPALFDAHAITLAGTDMRCLDVQLFNSTYAAILYAKFDSNNDGWLQLEEAQAALSFLKPQGLDTAHAIAFPPEAYTPQGVQLNREWFWSIFQLMG